jgi:hypothetical protein
MANKKGVSRAQKGVLWTKKGVLEILDVLTTALLADMERARWSGCPTVCADYQGHGFDFTVYVNREGTAEVHRRQRREQRESSVGDISENRVAHMGRPL